MADDYTAGNQRRRGMKCPICGVHSETIFARVLDANGTAHPMKPPRCGTCAEAWAEQNVFNRPKSYVIDSRVGPTTAEEMVFFRPYEEQMHNFKP
jgi:uncharacterized Zn finger protein